MKRPRIQHVSLPRPPGSHAETRAFYTDLLGLQEKTVPGTIQDLDLIWFHVGDDAELHLFTEQPIEDRSGRHFCLEVDDVEAMRQRLAAAGYETWTPVGIANRPRFFCRDPFGNTIEFTTILGSYE